MNFKSEFLNEIKERGFIYQDIEISELDNLMSKNDYEKFAKENQN